MEEIRVTVEPSFKITTTSNTSTIVHKVLHAGLMRAPSAGGFDTW